MMVSDDNWMESWREGPARAMTPTGITDYWQAWT